MDADSEHLKLLMAQRAYTEQRITANLDLQQKVIGAGLTAVLTALAWIFGAKTELDAGGQAMVLLAIVAISALSVLMAAVYGAWALGGMVFRDEVLDVALKNALSAREVFSPFKETWAGPAARPIAIGSVCVWGAHLLLSGVVYVGVLVTRRHHLDRTLVVGLIIVGLIFVGSLVSAWTFGSAVRAARSRSAHS